MCDVRRLILFDEGFKYIPPTVTTHCARWYDTMIISIFWIFTRVWYFLPQWPPLPSHVYMLGIECVWLVTTHGLKYINKQLCTDTHVCDRDIHYSILTHRQAASAFSKYKKNTIESSKWIFSFSTNALCWSLQSHMYNFPTLFSYTKPTWHHTPWMFRVEITMPESGLPLRFPTTQEVILIPRQW